jgi:hypothetical protein
MAKMTKDPLAEDVHIGVDDPGGPVHVRRTADGRAALLPTSRSGRQLGNDGLEVLADVQATIRDLDKLRDDLDQLVAEARELAVPWELIGFSVGLTGEAARKRWLDQDGGR